MTAEMVPAGTLQAVCDVVDVAPLRGDVRVVKDGDGLSLWFSRDSDLLLFMLALSRVHPGATRLLADQCRPAH